MRVGVQRPGRNGAGAIAASGRQPDGRGPGGRRAAGGNMGGRQPGKRRPGGRRMDDSRAAAGRPAVGHTYFKILHPVRRKLQNILSGKSFKKQRHVFDNTSSQMIASTSNDSFYTQPFFVDGRAKATYAKTCPAETAHDSKH